METSKVDVLKVYFGDDLNVGNIKVHQPTIGEILEYGELKFWLLAQRLCANTTSMKVSLWDAGYDWNELDDFELFIMLSTSIPVEDTKIIFYDLDFKEFKVVKDENDELWMIYMPEPSIKINKEIYLQLVGYLRTMFNIFPKTEKAKGKTTKELMIEEEKTAIKIESLKRKDDKWSPSVLFNLLSSAVNHPGFKYKKSEIKSIGIFEFMDSIKRLQVYESTTSFMTGMYMGMIDTKSIDLNKELNWVRDLYDD